MNYDAIAHRYDALYRSNRHRAENGFIASLVGEFVEGREGLRILDIGCGTGEILSWLHLDPSLYTGVDVSEPMLAVARAKHPRHRFVRADALTISGEFDLLISNFGSINYIGGARVGRWMRGLARAREMLFAFSVYEDGYRPDYGERGAIAAEDVAPAELGARLDWTATFSPILPRALDGMPERVWRAIMAIGAPGLRHRYRMLVGSCGPGEGA